MALDSLAGGVKGWTVSICHIRDGVMKFCEYDDPVGGCDGWGTRVVLTDMRRIKVVLFQTECH